MSLVQPQEARAFERRRGSVVGGDLHGRVRRRSATLVRRAGQDAGSCSGGVPVRSVSRRLACDVPRDTPCASWRRAASAAASAPTRAFEHPSACAAGPPAPAPAEVISSRRIERRRRRCRARSTASCGPSNNFSWDPEPALAIIMMARWRRAPNTVVVVLSAAAAVGSQQADAPSTEGGLSRRRRLALRDELRCEAMALITAASRVDRLRPCDVSPVDTLLNELHPRTPPRRNHSAADEIERGAHRRRRRSRRRQWAVDVARVPRSRLLRRLRRGRERGGVRHRPAQALGHDERCPRRGFEHAADKPPCLPAQHRQQLDARRKPTPRPLRRAPSQCRITRARARRQPFGDAALMRVRAAYAAHAGHRHSAAQLRATLLAPLNEARRLLPVGGDRTARLFAPKLGAHAGGVRDLVLPTACPSISAASTAAAASIGGREETSASGTSARHRREGGAGRRFPPAARATRRVREAAARGAPAAAAARPRPRRCLRRRAARGTRRAPRAAPGRRGARERLGVPDTRQARRRGPSTSLVRLPPPPRSSPHAVPGSTRPHPGPVPRAPRRAPPARR